MQDLNKGANRGNFLFNLIEEHRRIVLSSPFIFAAVLGVFYAFGGDTFRRVLDSLSSLVNH